MHLALLFVCTAYGNRKKQFVELMSSMNNVFGTSLACIKNGNSKYNTIWFDIDRARYFLRLGVDKERVVAVTVGHLFKSSTYRILNINLYDFTILPLWGYFCNFLIGGIWLLPPHYYIGAFPILPLTIFLNYYIFLITFNYFPIFMFLTIFQFFFPNSIVSTLLLWEIKIWPDFFFSTSLHF